MAELRQESAGNIKRRKEKERSAKLRSVAKGRSSFNDQSNVDKLYQWAKQSGKDLIEGKPAIPASVNKQLQDLYDND